MSDEQDWPSAIENSVFIIAVAVVLIVLALQIPSCCESYCNWKTATHEENCRETNIPNEPKARP